MFRARAGLYLGVALLPYLVTFALLYVASQLARFLIIKSQGAMLPPLNLWAIAYGVLIGIPVMVASLLLVAPGFFVGAIFALVAPSGIVEQTGLLTALRRGVSLARHVFGRVLLLLFSSQVALWTIWIAIGWFTVVALVRTDAASADRLLLTMAAVCVVALVLALVWININLVLLYYEACSRGASTVSAREASASQ